MKFQLMMYGFFASCVLPLAKVYLRKRAKLQPEYLEHWDERFGKCTYPAPQKPRLWLHAVSVGETNAARPLLESFMAENPDAEILLTCMTPTGRDVGAKFAARHPGRVVQCYLPYDTPSLMAKFLRETRPTLGIVMETEVWPNLMNEAAKAGVPVILANARESEKSLNQAMKFPELMGGAFGSFVRILAQSREDAERIETIGGKNIEVCGSVKFDIRPDAVQSRQAEEVRNVLARQVLLLASTRQGEEAMFVEEIKRVPAEVLVLLVPRHPQRFDEVAGLLDKAGISHVRKSVIGDLSKVGKETRVVLGDTMGEMSFNCAMGDVCIMGGSYGNFGCQNLIEPAAAGAPVIVGPSSFNFAKPVDDAVAMGGAVRVANAADAVTTAMDWLRDSEKLSEMSTGALAFAQSYTGATERMMIFVREEWARSLNRKNA